MVEMLYDMRDARKEEVMRGMYLVKVVALLSYHAPLIQVPIYSEAIIPSQLYQSCNFRTLKSTSTPSNVRLSADSVRVTHVPLCGSVIACDMK